MRLIDEAFQAAQLIKSSEIAAALVGTAARFAAGDDDLARLVREQQDLSVRWHLQDRAIIASLSRPLEERDRDSEQTLREGLAQVTARLDELSREINQKFPAYTEFVNPGPASIPELQETLADNEALLAYSVAGAGRWICLWVVRRDRAEMHRLDVEGDELAATIKGLREELDPGQMTGGLRRFDVAAAHALHKKLLPVDPRVLDGIQHLLIVPNGPLDSLPLGVLVGTEPKGEPSYSDIDWMAKRYAMTTLPSISALRALRRFAAPARAREPFRGVGDPLLSDHPLLPAAAARAGAAAEEGSSRTLASPSAVFQLPSLPDTAEELASLARDLGADEGNLILRERATESQVKAADLSGARIVAFATHAGVAGELPGTTEPALVLTPPQEASELDDGLLTASEAAQLRLNADFVLLSACHTASPDCTPGASGLSGLAKAFIYAGSRGLLVSHWQVYSDAAAKLTTGMLSELAREPGLGRAEALRRSMMATLEDRSRSHFAHPSAWAPFVIVGDGGATPPSPPLVAAAAAAARDGG